MKKITIDLLLSLLVSFFIGCIITLFATLYIYNHELDLNNDYRVPLFIARVLFYFIATIIFSYKRHENGLVNGLIFGLLIIGLAELFNTLALNVISIDVMDLIIMVLISMLGGLVGVNIPKNSKK